MGYHILVVDDSEASLELTSEMLSLMGHTTEAARNGQEAVTLATNKKVDIILIDFLMPVINGPKAVKMIREVEKPVAKAVIIGVTGMNQQFLHEEDIASMNGILNKPFTPKQLEHSIQKAVSQSDNWGSHVPKENENIHLNDFPLTFKDLVDQLGANKAGQLVALTLDDCRAALIAIRSRGEPLVNRAEIIHKSAGAAGVLGFQDLHLVLCEAETLARLGIDPAETELPMKVAAFIDATDEVLGGQSQMS